MKSSHATCFSLFSLRPQSNLVAHTDKVVGQLLDGRGCGTGLHSLGIMGDEDGLLGFDNHDAFFALRYEHGYQHLGRSR